MARPFAEIVKELAGGRTYEELTSALSEVTAAVIETRKTGSVTLTLKIKPNSDHSVLVTDTVKANVPEKTRGDTVFFTLADGTLRRDDPAQPKLPLRDVAEPEGDALKEVG